MFSSSSKVERPHVKPFRLVTYETAEECFKAYDPAYTPKGVLSGFSEKGKPYRMTYKTALKMVKKGMSWGWANYRTREVHVWYDGRIRFGTLIMTLAHEIAHVFDTQNKRHKQREIFAGACADSARCAYDITKSLLESRRRKRTSQHLPTR